MKPLILSSCILLIQCFYIKADSHVHHHSQPNVVRISLGGNAHQHPNHRSQLLRQAVPITTIRTPTTSSPTTFTTTAADTTTTTTTTTTIPTPVLEDSNVSCSQTVDVSSGNKPTYNFVVDKQNTANLHCVITIFGQRGKQLLLQLTEVDLQPGIFDCEFDSVQVFSLSGGKLSFKDKFCNLSQPSPEILTEKNVAVLTFNAGNQQNEQGFKIEIRSVLLGNKEESNSGYTDIGADIHNGYVTGSYTGYVTNYNSSYTGYKTPMYNVYPSSYINNSYSNYGPPNKEYMTYPNSYINISHTRYGPPNKDYKNEYTNISYTNYGIPQYTQPSKIQYQNVNDCNKEPWKIIGTPEVRYSANLPAKSHSNNDFYSWLTSATKENNWSKEILDTPNTVHSFRYTK